MELEPIERWRSPFNRKKLVFTGCAICLNSFYFSFIDIDARSIVRAFSIWAKSNLAPMAVWVFAGGCIPTNRLRANVIVTANISFWSIACPSLICTMFVATISFPHCADSFMRWRRWRYSLSTVTVTAVSSFTTSCLKILGILSSIYWVNHVYKAFFWDLISSKEV